MSCECLDRIDGLLAERGDNTKLKRSYWLGSSVGMTVTVASEKIEPKRGKATAIKPTFCPFCGTRYDGATP